MSNFNVVRLGQKDNAGDSDALFLVVWSGEVLSAFAETNKAFERTMSRNITSGKSAQFPATWKATAAYHTPGTELTGSLIANNERLITIDDLLVSDLFLYSLDEAKAHYEFRGEYTKQTGAALARQMDKNIFQVGLLAARASATVTGGNGGTAITQGSALTDADLLVGAIFDAAQTFDEKDVPEDDRFCYLKPAQYNLLVESSSKAIHRDYDGAGSISDGLIARVAGVQIVKTNNLPQSNITSGPAAYQGNFSTVAALVMHRSAVGTVKLLDLSTEMEYLITRQGHFIVSKYAVGHGILRPESSVEIKTS